MCDVLFLVPTVPPPMIEIESVGTPYIGTIYILSCLVSVSEYVDTNISISSNWSLSSGPITSSPTITNSTTEETGNKQFTDLMFSPLREDDNGSYTCATDIESDIGFILRVSDNRTTPIVVIGRKM